MNELTCIAESKPKHCCMDWCDFFEFCIKQGFFLGTRAFLLFLVHCKIQDRCHHQRCSITIGKHVRKLPDDQLNYYLLYAKAKDSLKVAKQILTNEGTTVSQRDRLIKPYLLHYKNNLNVTTSMIKLAVRTLDLWILQALDNDMIYLVTEEHTNTIFQTQRPLDPLCEEKKEKMLLHIFENKKTCGVGNFSQECLLRTFETAWKKQFPRLVEWLIVNYFTSLVNKNEAKLEAILILNRQVPDYMINMLETNECIMEWLLSKIKDINQRFSNTFKHIESTMTKETTNICETCAENNRLKRGLQQESDETLDSAKKHKLGDGDSTYVP